MTYQFPISVPPVFTEENITTIMNNGVMSEEHLAFFKTILGIPTKYGDETRMTAFLDDYFQQKGYEHFVDTYGNVYATKGNAEYVPCVIAHIDTVHNIDEMVINQEENMLYATNADGKDIGIGGDDKNGVFIALRLFEEFDNLKVAFFVSEEIGCIGSKHSDDEFFKNVGYVIQFDAPEDYMITHYCDGTKIFDENGEFYTIAGPIIHNYFGDAMRLFKHPYTDVSIMKRKYDFSCINLSCGYYNMHSKFEYVLTDIVESSVNLGLDLIKELGEKLYFFEREKKWPR